MSDPQMTQTRTRDRRRREAASKAIRSELVSVTLISRASHLPLARLRRAAGLDDGLRELRKRRTNLRESANLRMNARNPERVIDMHDDDVIGKAYDSRLMRRLLGYLRPYWRTVVVALLAIVTHSVLQLAPPYLTKLVIDTTSRPGTLGRARARRGDLPGRAGGLVRARVRADLADAADRPAHHVRPADAALRAPAAAGPAVLRPQPRRTADDARDERRRRAERAVHVRRRRGLRRHLHAGRDHDRDARHGLAAGAGQLRRAAADRGRHAMVPRATCASRIAPCARWIARINTFLQENLTGMATVQLFRREGRNGARFDEINAGASRRQHRVDLLLRGVLSGHRTGGRPGGLDHHLGRRPRRPRRHADARACWSPSCSTRRGSTGRSATCRRSSTSCSRPWPRPSASSRCSTRRCRWPARRTPVVPRQPLQGHIVFDHVWFAYSGRGLGAARRVVRGAARPAPRAGRRHRVGQDDDHQPAAAVLRHPARSHPGRRRRHQGPRPGDPARAVRPGAAGRAPVLGNAGRQHPARP